MTVSKDPVNKAVKKIQRELERFRKKEISIQEFTRRIVSIQEYYQV